MANEFITKLPESFSLVYKNINLNIHAIVLYTLIVQLVNFLI